MTKKNFIALADAIKSYNMYANRDGQPKFGEHHLYLLADVCKRQNPRFNRERWLGYIAGENGPDGGNIKKETK